MDVLPTLKNDSIDLSVYSPPFAGLYNYSSSEKDFSNCESKEQFLEQYEFLVKEISRVQKREGLRLFIVPMFLIIPVGFGIFQTKLLGYILNMGLNIATELQFGKSL
jgi:hypothetical protein